MARLRLRDKIYNRRVGRTLTAPTSILLAGGGVAIGLAAGLPLVLAAGIGAAAWAARVALAMPRGIDNDGIDPYALTEPWRSYVWKAKRSKRQFFDAVKSTRKGPLHDRLDAIADRIDTGVGEINRIAQSGQALSTARAQIDEQAIKQELTQINWTTGGPPQPGSSRAATVAALESQLATAARLDRVISDTTDQLTLLGARLDEAVTRAIELSARGHRVDEMGSVVSDVDAVVGDMEALREALDETDRTSSNQMPATGFGPSLPEPTSGMVPPPAPSLPQASDPPLPTMPSTAPAPAPQTAPAPAPQTAPAPAEPQDPPPQSRPA